MEIAAIIFDMDGVLINSEPLWMQAEIEIFATVGLHLTLKDCEATRGVRIINVVEHWHMQHPWLGKSIATVCEEITNRVIELIYEKGAALPGLNECLNLIIDKKIPIGLATSSSENIIEAVVSKLGIAKYFNAIHSADHELYGKPHPAVYLNCALKLNAVATDCIAIEDSITGIIAAKAARMKVVALPEPELYNDPRFSIADKKIMTLFQFDEGLIDGFQTQFLY